MFRQFLLTTLILATLMQGGTAAFGQVLTPPDNSGAESLTPIKLTGVVVEQKKYSFDVQTKDQRYVVTPTPDAVFTLRMNKPIFDFPNQQVKVLRSMSALAPASEKAETNLGRVTFDLPDKLYVISRFEHVQHMERVMEQSVKRINNYLLTSQDDGDIHPSETQLLIGGELSPGSEATVATLKIADKTYSVMLGHRRASMTGFSIADLEPQATEVYIWGQVDTENKLTADRIEFRPIATPANQTNVADENERK